MWCDDSNEREFEYVESSQLGIMGHISVLWGQCYGCNLSLISWDETNERKIYYAQRSSQQGIEGIKIIRSARSHFSVLLRSMWWIDISIMTR